MKARSNLYAWGRVTLFFIAFITVVLFANAKMGEGVVLTVAFFVGFFFMMLKKHLKVKKDQRFNEEMARINAEEIQRLQGDFQSFDCGSEFLDPAHDYHSDLDIFGRHSIFQLINRTSTVFGRNILAEWLGRAASRLVIEERQAAVGELRSKLHWRQELQAHGRSGGEEKPDPETLLRWIKEPPAILGQKQYRWAVYVFPAATMAGIISAVLGIVSAGLPILMILFNLIILGTVFSRAQAIYRKTISSNKALKAYEAQIKLIEQADVDSPYLLSLKGRLVHEQGLASGAIRQLQFILDNLHNRANLMYHIFNIVLLLDIYWLIRAEKWKENTRADIELWFKTVGEMECLASMAGFYFANPDYTFPNISRTPFLIRGEALGHPLIRDELRVTNDFDFSGKGGICLITGSNMSGKSTFLRTLGVNVVLALMGSPVCARSLITSELKVFTSMRTQDDLEESISSFYAELKRLKQLLNTIGKGKPVLFMLDEVLKGTNSEDRHKGAIALIRQLSRANAFGLVSTHDIGLGAITDELQGVKNYSFNSLIEGNEIIFDYRLTPGICKSFNATRLMQKMGIEIID